MSEALSPKPLDAHTAEQPVAGPGERRKVAILFCDMVGSTSIAAALDPEELSDLSQAYETAVSLCITRLRGSVFRLQGDGVLAQFGFPEGLEWYGHRAVYAALDILEKIQSLYHKSGKAINVRIGIAEGEARVSLLRGPEGEVVNRAARLANADEAPIGGVVIDEEVHRLLDSTFRCDSIGALDLDGLGEPVKAYRVTGVERIYDTRFDAITGDKLTKLVGREREFEALRERWNVARSMSGQGVLVYGEPGVGKSRIVRALRERAEQDGAAMLAFQCSDQYEHSAFYPIIDYLERLLGFARDQSAESRLERVAEFVDAAGLSREDIRYLAALLSLPYPAPADAPVLTGRRQKEETVRTLVDFVAAAARERPLLLLFEDLHWADPTTLEVLDELLKRASDMKLLALFTCRSNSPVRSRWPHRVIRATLSTVRSPRTARVAQQPPGHVDILELSRLTRAESTTLVYEVIGGQMLPGEDFEQIIEKSDGIPLFLEELTKTVLEQGALPSERDSSQYEALSALVKIPRAVYGSLRARLDELGTPARQVAHICAVIGREFSYDLIVRVTAEDIPTIELNRSLSRLVKSGLALRGKGSDAVYRFKHALVQDVAYSSLLNTQRRTLHARIAREIERWPETEPELLAYHYTKAERFDQAIPLWRDAGRLALKRFALDEAIKHLDEGLKHLHKLPDESERQRLELELRTAYGPAVVARRGWAHSDVPAKLEPAWRLPKQLYSQESYLRILNSLWVHYLSVAKLTISLQWADELLRAGADARDEVLEMVAHRAKAGSYFWLADFDAARWHGHKVRAMYHPERHRHVVGLINTDPRTGEGIYLAQYLWMLGYVDDAARVSDEKDRHAQDINHPFDYAFALTLGAQAFGFRREPEELLERADTAEKIARDGRITLLSDVLAKINRGIAHIRAGRASQGVADLDSSITEFMAKHGHRVWVSYLRAVQAEGLAMLGDLEGALKLVDESLENIESGEDRVYHAEVLRIRGWLLVQRGDSEAAEVSIRKALDVARRQKTKSWELRAAMDLARLLACRGEHAAGHDLLADVYAWFEDFGQGLGTKDLVDAQAVMAQLQQETNGTQPSKQNP